MKLRIFKKEDGSVIYNYPSERYQGGTFIDDLSKPIVEIIDGEESVIGYEKRELTFDDCKIPEDCQGLPFIVLDESEAHPSNSNTGDYHEMIHFDGDCAKENLKQDKNWEVRLMPQFLVKEKHIDNLNKNIDALLGTNIKDPIEIISVQREKEKAFAINDEFFWLEKALEGLDRRIREGKEDKVIIRQKIEEKLKSKE